MNLTTMQLILGAIVVVPFTLALIKALTAR